MPWTGPACAASCSRRRPRRAISCCCSGMSPKRSPIPIWPMSGPSTGPICASRRRDKPPRWPCSACSTGPRRELVVQTSRTKRSADFIALLETLDRRYGPEPGRCAKPVVLVLDNGPIHTSKATHSRTRRAGPLAHGRMAAEIRSRTQRHRERVSREPLNEGFC